MVLVVPTALFVLAPIASGIPTRAEQSAAVGSVPTGADWLAEINMYRAAAQLAPVTDQPAWDAGIVDHLKYLADTPSSYMTGVYASMHTENPSSPYYTPEGAQEGSSSDLQGSGGDPVQAIDTWLECPFHAVGMLRARLGQVAFASGYGYAGLDVLSGLGQQPTVSFPILFPGPGMTTDLTNYCGAESPSPVETCGWQQQTPGLPLIALLTSAPSAELTASLQAPNGQTVTSQSGNLCVVDSATFRTTDTVYGPTGAEILANDNAVFLVPRSSLVPGSYQVTISQPGEADITWSFHVAPMPVVITSRLFPAVVGTPYSTALAASGGEGLLAWSVQSGQLPAGLSASAAGAITGTPSAPGTYRVVFRVTDARGLTSVSGPVPITVYRSAASDQIQTFALEGKATSKQLAADGGSPPYAWSIVSGSLPAGLSLSPSGVLSGTSLALAFSTVTVRITDAAGQSAQEPLSVSVVHVNPLPRFFAYVSSAIRS